jgi:hypothetical protein
MKSLILRFQTSALIPAPYAYAIEGYFSFDQKGLEYKFDLEYLDRDQLTEDEILEEGFSMEDNLTLSGKLPIVWKEQLENLVLKTEKTYPQELEDDQEFWDIEIGSENYYPKNSKHWKEFIEELQQAVIEQNKLENPLQITVIRSDNETQKEYKIKGNFEQKSLTIESCEKQSQLPWHKLKPLLKDFYSAEFDYEKATAKLPKKTGLFLNFGDDYWFELGKSYLTKPSKITSWLENQE